MPSSLTPISLEDMLTNSIRFEIFPWFIDERVEPDDRFICSKSACLRDIAPSVCLRIPLTGYTGRKWLWPFQYCNCYPSHNNRLDTATNTVYRLFQASKRSLTVCCCCDPSSRRSFLERTISYHALAVCPGFAGNCVEEIISPLDLSSNIVGYFRAMKAMLGWPQAAATRTPLCSTVSRHLNLLPGL